MLIPSVPNPFFIEFLYTSNTFLPFIVQLFIVIILLLLPPVLFSVLLFSSLPSSFLLLCIRRFLTEFLPFLSCCVLLAVRLFHKQIKLIFHFSLSLFLITPPITSTTPPLFFFTQINTSLTNKIEYDLANHSSSLLLFSFFWSLFPPHSAPPPFDSVTSYHSSDNCFFVLLKIAE